MSIEAILTDIEGTTTSLAFVHATLFPYAARHLAEFIAEEKGKPEVRRWIEAAKREAGDPEMGDDEAVATLKLWIAEDRKATPLKALQGLLWERGYVKGDYTGHLYEDAARNLAKWHADGLKLYVFSSGSVPAQKLLFRHSDHGDLTPLFSGYFDTTVGHKRDITSYAAIALAIDIHPAKILFLSDIVEELEAARGAGMLTTRLARPGEYELLPDCSHPQARSFDEIDPSRF